MVSSAGPRSTVHLLRPQRKEPVLPSALPGIQLENSESLHFHHYRDCLRNNGFHFADLYGVSTYHLINAKKKTKPAI